MSSENLRDLDNITQSNGEQKLQNQLSQHESISNKEDEEVDEEATNSQIQQVEKKLEEFIRENSSSRKSDGGISNSLKRIEEEKNQLLGLILHKNSQNHSSIDSTNSKNEATATEPLNCQKKNNPRLLQISADAVKEQTNQQSQLTDSVLNQSISSDNKQMQMIFNDEEENVEQKIKEKNTSGIMLKILESGWFMLAVNTLTVYSLFGDNIRIMATRQSADLGFDIVTILTLSLFCIEMVLSIAEKKDYLCSFFFWLDLMSTLSIILDINLLSSLMFPSSGGQVNGIAKAGQASRVGSKAGRVVRLVRLIRVLKNYRDAQISEQNKSSQPHGNLKLLEKMQKRKMKKKVHPSQSSDQKMDNSSGQFNDIEEGNRSPISTQSSSKGTSTRVKGGFNPPKESKVSKILTDMTTKRVIILVLILILIMPLFSSDYFFDPPTPIELSVRQVKMVSEISSTQYQISNQAAILKQMLALNSNPLVKFTTPFTFIQNYEDSDYVNLRDEELKTYEISIDISQFQSTHSSMTSEISHLQGIIDSNQSLLIKGEVSTRDSAVFAAALSFGQTIFVCIILTAGVLLFSKDANDYALGPIERMRDKVIAIANDPLSSKDQKLISDDNNKEQYETVIIENAIVKIGTLLALGFGEAGSEIIAINMARQGDVDPMIPGKKKCAVYGFCDIRNFTDATEVLQEDVMLFVNNIGDIVHTITDRYLGAANKNIGDAFLLVWRIVDSKYSINESTNEITFSDQQYISILADFSALAFMRIQSQINRVTKILAYREDHRLQERIDNYKVKMGFGLHIGWGIEGAIGSEFKIDASYLSPNVNMAARLEAATKQYGVPLLISSDLQSYFSPEMKKYARYIDRVTVKGSVRPIGLYIIDMNVDNLPEKNEIDPNFTKFDIHGINQMKKEDMREYMEQALSGENPWSADQYIKKTKDLRLLFQNRNEDFHRLFSLGFSKYLEGNWVESRNILNEGLIMIPDDGPSKTIIEVMGSSNFQSPHDWKGFRELTEK